MNIQIEKMINSIAKQLLESMNAQICTIRTPNWKKRQLGLAAFCCRGGDGKEALGREEFIGFKGTIAGDAILNKKIIYVPDVSKDERYSGVIENGDPKYLLSIPLLFQEDSGSVSVLGVAQVYAYEKFTEEKISYAESIAQLAGLALYHDQFALTSRKAILDIAKAIVKDISVQKLFQHTVERLSETLKVERCTIYQITSKKNEDEENYECEIVAGTPIDDHGIFIKEKLSAHPDIMDAVKERRVILIENPLVNKNTSYFKEMIAANKINQILYVPLLMNLPNTDKTIINGVIVLDATKQKQSFSQEEIECCCEISQLIVLMLYRSDSVFKSLTDKVRNKASVAANDTRRTRQFLDEAIGCLGNLLTDYEEKGGFTLVKLDYKKFDELVKKAMKNLSQGVAESGRVLSAAEAILEYMQEGSGINEE